MPKPKSKRPSPAPPSKPRVVRPKSRSRAAAAAPARTSAASRPTASARPQFWLLKSEPNSFSFSDLQRSPGARTAWTGVRNYQSRNFLRDTMSPGDLVLFYHSSAEPTGIAGLARIASRASPDPTQFDPDDDHFDPDAVRESPPWVQVEVEAVAPLPRFVSLQDLKSEPRLARMLVVQRGSRLSVQPVQEGEWRVVLALAGLDPDDF